MRSALPVFYSEQPVTSQHTAKHGTGFLRQDTCTLPDEAQYIMIIPVPPVNFQVPQTLHDLECSSCHATMAASEGDGDHLSSGSIGHVYKLVGTIILEKELSYNFFLLKDLLRR